MKYKHLLVPIFLVFSFSDLAAQSYPFTLPDTITAFFDVNTNDNEIFNNKLLGYNIFGYTSNSEKDFIRKFDPITIRFPAGVWSNFYNWETDGYTRYNDSIFNNAPHSKVIENYIHRNVKAGFSGLTVLNREKKLVNKGKGYDVLWTYNLNYDSNKKTVERLINSDLEGFDVQDIELSNENFWVNQRSTRISTPQKFLNVAKSLSDTLRKVKPGIRLSVPLSWRTSHKNYNAEITSDTTYFDAITIHKYIGSDPDKKSDSNLNYGDILTARNSLENDVDYARSFAPGKPVWLTEWGVNIGPQAAAFLGMADCYLFLSENQKVYDRANWFCVNGVLNSFITFSGNRVIKYPLEITGFGAVYKIIRDVFENSTMLAGSMTTSKLKPGSNAVNARVVIRKGKIVVIAVNLTDRPVDFTLNFDNKKYGQSYNHEAMAFDCLSENKIIGIDANPLNVVKSGRGKIILPALSINKIAINNRCLKCEDINR